ncbi:MAG: PD40 domain-containing protein [Bacteroidales bacterium]|nr:PD40 domain-containing protein [Bacteroidales bacterium]
MKRFFAIIILLTIVATANAQYYNGLQMSFGKNRIQYKPFTWRYLPYDTYDVYFYDRGVNLGKYAAENIDKIMAEYENYFSVIYHEKVLFVIYNKLGDFRQSNVGLQTGNIEFNLGGDIQLLDNKVFIYYEGDHQKFEQNIRKAIARLYVRKILYGTAFTDKLANSTLLNVPPWFEEGLVSYVAQPYDINVFNNVRDMLENRKKIQFNHLIGEQATYIGHSFWYFIAETYGEDVISNILYFAKISKSIKNAVYFVLGKSLNKITDEWRAYYEAKFDIENKNVPDYASEVYKSKKKRIYQNFKISPDGKNVAFVENFEGKYKVFMYNSETDEKQKLYKEGQRLEQIVDYSYPYLSWNHSGKILAFTTEKESIVTFWTYNLEKDELKSKILPYISKVLSFSFSPNGYYVAFSAISNGYTDIFVFNMLTSQMERITYDLADDLSPQFNQYSDKIIFSSNRTYDTIQRFFNYEDNYPLSKTFDLYFLDFKAENIVVTPLTATKFSNENEVISAGNDRYFFLSDSSGVNNRYLLNFDSTISFIDTIVHYRYVTKITQVTEYTKNIESQDIKRNYIGEILLDNKKMRMFEYPFSYDDISNNSIVQKPTYFRAKYYKNQIYKLEKQKENIRLKEFAEKKLDSLYPYYQAKILAPDTSKIDINNYVFEVEKDTVFRAFFEKENAEKKDTSRFPQMRVYHPTFYINDLKSQIDFSMLNQTYQPFTGGPFFFNPGMSLFTTVGIDELFNDYKLLGGFRWGFNNSMEYLLSIENLKKRVDKQLIFYRQVLSNDFSQNDYEYNLQKMKVNQLMFILRYPFNQVTSVKGTLMGKYDRTIHLSTEYTTLVEPDHYSVYTGAKIEYIFDNTKDLSLNLMEGIRFKVFGEFYQQVEGDFDYTVVLGADLRVYKKIFRNFIYAGRIAGSTSQGSGKVLYYLGGVDNWYDLSFDPTGKGFFDQSVNINYDENYLFQAVATNMRGFSQNIRNGNSFLLSNQELRLPIIQVFANHPMNSEFWYNLQVVGFFDIGSAWNGWSPYDEKNIYNTIIVQRDPFTVIVDIDRPPFVYSYGFGLRTKLLGYFVRLDWAYGKEGHFSHDPKFYFSLSLDF